jgi:hypothetical protein
MENYNKKKKLQKVTNMVNHGEIVQDKLIKAPTLVWIRAVLELAGK